MNSLRDLTHRELYVVIELLRAPAAGKP